MADTVIIDSLYQDKLEIAGVGDTAEINGHRVRVVGITRGIRSFTTSPFVFTLTLHKYRLAEGSQAACNAPR